MCLYARPSVFAELCISHFAKESLHYSVKKLYAMQAGYCWWSFYWQCVFSFASCVQGTRQTSSRLRHPSGINLFINRVACRGKLTFLVHQLQEDDSDTDADSQRVYNQATSVTNVHHSRPGDEDAKEVVESMVSRLISIQHVHCPQVLMEFRPNLVLHPNLSSCSRRSQKTSTFRTGPSRRRKG